MNRAVKVITGYILTLFWITGLQAQEVIMPLWGNPQLARQQSEERPVRKSSAVTQIDLPVFDDFSDRYIVPDGITWSDAFTFVNNNYCVDPVTNGVATLDAIDDGGSIYASAVISPSTFVADHLTSQPVQLEYPASDSIYLSFFYQPGGLCDLPEEQDSLMVDFFAPDSAEWINVWRVPGSDLHSFRQVMIPVTDERFLVSGFRFRFRNRASLSRSDDYPDMRSNVDYWHVDYVRLDRNRFAADTVLRDVAFTAPLNSILKDLTSIPWSHFEQAYNTVVDPFVIGNYRNNDTITRNVTRSLIIHDPVYNETYEPGLPTAQDLPAQEDTTVHFAYIYPFNFTRGDSAVIRFKASLRTDEFDPKVNDTVIHDQLFKDFYAYDDGTPEAGYGLRGGGTGDGVVALKYYAFQPDQLGGVYIHFNQVYDSLNLNYYFNLVVWDDADGEPGSVIWEDENEYKPVYSADYPEYVAYTFSEPVSVNGPFYVGWRQYNEFLLNMGLDLNNRPVPPVMFYNLGGTWQASAAPGVIMFRPFMYDPTTGQESDLSPSREFQVYPNPASDRIYLQLPETEASEYFRVEIFDATGRQIDQDIISSDAVGLDVSGYSSGIYYMRIKLRSHTYHSKFLINQ